jgi:hypothetical protein
METLEKSIALERCQSSAPKGLVILLHHFGGSRKTLRRHKELYLSAGFDVMECDLPFHGREKLCSPFFLREKYVSRLDRMESLGRAKLRAGMLGVHAFSSTSSATLSWLARSPERRLDFLICENGPFLDFSEVRRRTVRFFLRPKWELLEKFLGWGAQVFWDQSFNKTFAGEIREWTARADSTIPQMLFLLCENDELIPPAQTQPLIGLFHQARTHLFKREGHLTALKNQSAEYRRVLAEFLGQPFPTGVNLNG